eukprot:gene15447-17029_t
MVKLFYAVFAYLLLAMYCFAQDPQLISEQAKSQVRVINRFAKPLQRINVGLGIFSRSLSVSALSKVLRGEDGASVRESFEQAVATLSVLDISGGILAPYVNALIQDIASDPAFRETREALKQFGTPMTAWADDLKNLRENIIAGRLKSAKNTILQTFKNEVGQLSASHPAMKHIKKARTWLGVKVAGNVLGPIFDLATVGINVWSLSTAVRDCTNSPTTCNYGAITSAALSITSGLIGIASFAATLFASATVAAFAGPIGAVVAAVLGITATLIELFYTPPPDPAIVARLEKENRMRQLDVYSRIQLNSVNTIMSANNIGRDDLYVANQGHLPKWFSYSPAVNNLKFGKNREFNPRKKQPMVQQCYNPIWGDASDEPGMTPHRRYRACPYLVDGREFESTSNSGVKLGYSFYGWTNTARTYLKSSVSNPPDDDPPYRGSMIMIPTDKVQPDVLREKGNEANLRGFDIDTGAKGNDNGNHHDMIAIGDMPTLDIGSEIRIRTGNGNDALNIDGRIGPFSRENVLDAELGPGGNNSLNFGAIASDSPITGVRFFARDGLVLFKHAAGVQRVGTVKHVSFLGASPFYDEIYLYANKAGEKGVDFSVFKFKGLATYKLDISRLKTQSETRHFKINDDTEGESGCEGHVPLLKLYSMDEDAKANDIIFKDNKIHVYGNRGHASSPQGKKGTDKKTIETRSCPGEHGGNVQASHGKVLLATIEFNTKCSGKIFAKARGGACVMRRRKKSELDTKFFPGNRHVVHFNRRNYQGTMSADYVVLNCPSSEVTEETTIDLTLGSSNIHVNSDTSDYLVVSSNMFFDPCGIEANPDEDGSYSLLSKNHGVEDTWTLWISGPPSSMFSRGGRSIVLKGVDKIINEFGHTVVDLNNPPQLYINLYDEYAKKTSRNIAHMIGRDRTEEVMNNLLSCIQQSGNLSDEEREEICGPDSN